MEKTISLIDLPAGFYLVREDQCPKSLLKNHQSQLHRETAVISKDFKLIPFLSLKDNLLLGVKKTNHQNLTAYLEFVELSPEILANDHKQLSRFQQMKLQFVRMLLQQKKTTLLSSCYKELSIKEVQWLLPFCHKLAHSRKIKIVLFSSDKELCQTPYIDQIF